MCRPEEVKNDLHRVECCKRNFNEQGVPVAHRTVPESRKLKRLKLASLIALRADEACILVHIFQKVEALALIIVETAYDIYRIEVGSRSKSVACMVV